MSALSLARRQPLIGREVELARLRAAQRSGARTLLVTGDAGIGKTMLCEHALAEMEADGALVLRGSGVPGGDVPFGVVLRAADSAPVGPSGAGHRDR
ncbi:MAG: ATP-binding protein [Pseudonocardia sp.]|nr:ATP-binding protein [Pseudonocardia sp.]